MRLNHRQNESLHLWPGLIDEIWMPDLFFVNAKNSHVHDGVTESKFKLCSANRITISDRQLQIKSKGRVFVSMRVSLTLACQMDFKYYPFDWQICPLEMGSFGYSKRDVLFDFDTTTKGIQIADGIRLPRHRLRGHFTRDCVK